MKRWLGALAALTALAMGLAAVVVWLNLRGEAPLPPPDSDPTHRRADPRLIERGAYLARAGNCMACHTARGGEAYAGGRAMETPFGNVYSSNLTPDAATGIGRWSSAEFWRAMHHGRSRDGRLLYPAFPYTNYTLVTREDSDAIHAYLHSLRPVAQPNRPHTLRFPYNTQAALAVWRALYFQPARFEPNAQETTGWNRGAYLTQGLTHCSACHSPRDAWGGIDRARDLAGGLLPVQNWYAPALTDPREAGVSAWPIGHIVQLLQTGVAPGASVAGPMAEVVQHSTQFLTGADLAAIAEHLQRLPGDASATRRAPVSAVASAPASDKAVAPSPLAPLGVKVYERHCAGCHGDAGQGVANAYPALAGNRAVTMGNVANLVQVVLHGGYPPVTAGHPRPFGMPPYLLTLTDREVAAVLTHLRSAWGHQAPAVSELDVNRLRASAAP